MHIIISVVLSIVLSMIVILFCILNAVERSLKFNGLCAIGS